MASTGCGLQSLHALRIVHRDLKPENLVLNAVGQMKIADLGLAKMVIGKTYTTCGTPDYFAPELLDSTGHTCSLDWWVLGVLLFELMTGHSPFEATTPMGTFRRIMRGLGHTALPVNCKGPVGDLMKALLKREPSRRLPARPGGLK